MFAIGADLREIEVPEKKRCGKPKSGILVAKAS